MSAGAAGHVLLVEDETETAATLALYLERAGFRVTRSADGAQGLELARRLAPDLVLLDLLLPGLDGREVCRRLRAEGSLPIVMLTALGDEEARIAGLAAGADDYVPKPFSPREVVARVRAVLRRTRGGEGAPQPGERLCFDGLVLERSARRLTCLGQPVDLTRAEFELFATLLAAPGRVFTRSELIERALGHGAECEERTIDAHVKNLRRKLRAAAGDAGAWITTVFGSGYRLEARRGA